MKPDLVILTNSFPNAGGTSETWLDDELRITHHFYSRIFIVPPVYSGQFVELPANCTVLDPSDANTTLTIADLFRCLSTVLSDLDAYPRKSAYLKAFRYNLALVRNLYLAARQISSKVNISKDTIIYAYWADNLATTACMIRQMHPACKVITRGHGFEIFEEQTNHGVIPFRRFQFKYLDKLFADSKRGMEHLNSTAKTHEHINACAYVGTKDQGLSIFDEAASFAMATCSHVRGVKRLHLMPGILKHIDFSLVWHILGDGEDLDKIRALNVSLPKNIQVVYHGYLNNGQILDFYRTHSINLFASLSYSEGLPVSMMEAQSFGMPIMSTDVGGCREICNEETGFLVERDFDEADVASKIKAFKDSGKNTIAFRKQCRTFWEKHFNAEVNYTAFARTITAL